MGKLYHAIYYLMVADPVSRFCDVAADANENSMRGSAGTSGGKASASVI